MLKYIDMEATNLPISSLRKPIGAGSFLNPDLVSSNFDIREGMSVADFGCGAGFFAVIIGHKVGEAGKVYALDIMDNALDSVSAKASEEKLTNIQTIRTNLEILGSSSLPNDSQDIVLLANILFQSTKKDGILKESTRILKKGGRIIILDWKKGVNGFGPPDSLRIGESDLRSLVEKEGFSFVKNIDAGDFHFGIMLVKK